MPPKELNHGVHAQATSHLATEQTTLLSDVPTTSLDQMPPTVVSDTADPSSDEAEALIALKNLEKRRADKKRSQRLKIAGAIGLIALAAGAYFLHARLSAKPQPVDLGPEMGIVERKDFTTSVQGSGALAPYDSAVVTPEVDGIIETVSVKEGQSVGVGDVLFTIKNDELDKAISTAADNLSAAQRDLGEASSALDEIYAAIDKDRAAYEAASKQAASDTKRAEEAYNKAYHEHDAAVSGAKSAFDRATSNEQATLAVQDAAEATYQPLQDRFEAAQKAYEEKLASFNEDTATRDHLKAQAERTPEEERRLADLEKEIPVLYKKLYGETLIDLDRPWPVMNPRYSCLKKDMDDAAAACTTPREKYEAAILQHDLALDTLDDATAAYNKALEAADAAGKAAAAVIPIAPVPDFSETAAQAQISSAQSAVTAASNAVNTASKSYDEAVATAEKRTVKAAKAGTVMSVGAVAGQAVGSGATGTGSLVQIADISKMKVAIQVNEIDIDAVKVGQRAACTFSALPGVELAGKVTSVASTAGGSNGENSAGGGGVVTFAVAVVIDKPGNKVKPGMTASVNIFTQDVPDALVVPVMALEEMGGKTYVNVIVDQETMQTEQREVKIGARGASEAVVEQGLSEGELVSLGGAVTDTAAVEGEVVDAGNVEG